MLMLIAVDVSKGHRPAGTQRFKLLQVTQQKNQSIFNNNNKKKNKRETKNYREDPELNNQCFQGQTCLPTKNIIQILYQFLFIYFESLK